MSARRADLRDAVFGENSFRELRARLVFTPRSQLGLTEPIDPHVVTSDMNRNWVSRKPRAVFRSACGGSGRCDVLQYCGREYRNRFGERRHNVVESARWLLQRRSLVT